MLRGKVEGALSVIPSTWGLAGGLSLGATVTPTRCPASPEHCQPIRAHLPTAPLTRPSLRRACTEGQVFESTPELVKGSRASGVQ